MTNSIGLYVHIPFCKSKCSYCDFNSQTNLQLIPLYLNCLRKEMKYYSYKNFIVKTVYIGGGTPTILKLDDLRILLDSINTNFDLKHVEEFTIEANPGTLTEEKLILLKKYGINRLSIGLQACQDRLLKVMNRSHSLSDFESSFAIARKIGFDNINVDTIFGLPCQSVLDFKNTLKYLAVFSPEHISCYSLSVEKGTRFYKLLRRGRLSLPAEEDERKMYHIAVEFLKKVGYDHYEISNFAKQNRKSMHNMIYWNDEDYLGLGAGSHSYISNIRFCNITSLKKYIKALISEKAPVAQMEYIDEKTHQAEFCFMRLRLVEGIKKSDFYLEFGKDIHEVYGKAIKKLKEQRLLTENERFLKLTTRGLDFANNVFMEFLL